MTRVRTDNVFGTITDNPLTSGATTMNSAGLANLAAVSSTEAIITLDPNRVAGAPEIVVVTAHTGSATSATIQRGQFGTTARQHASGTAWVHGPIASNASTYVTAADDQGDFVPMNAWESWTPTFTNFTLGNGTLVAEFVRVGRTIHWYLKVIFGSTSSISGEVTFTLPVTPSGTRTANIDLPSTVQFLDFGTAQFQGGGIWVSPASFTLKVWGSAGTYSNMVGLSSTVPMTWATSDTIVASGTYQAST